MAFDPHRNLAYSTVAIAPVPGISGTTVTLQAGDGAKFVAGLNVLVWPAGTSRALISNAEIARVTLVTGDVLTLVRATTTEPTAIGPRVIVVGDQIANAITAKTFLDIEAAIAVGPTGLTNHGVIIGQAGAGLVATSPGAAGQLLTSNGASADPSFQGGTQATALVGVQNNFALNAGVTFLYCDNATLLTLSGFTAGYDGQILDIVSRGTGQVDILNQGTNSTAGNRTINGVTGPVSASPGSGRFRFRYDLATARWRLLQHAQGAMIVVPYNAGDFSSATSTWGVDLTDIQSHRYSLDAARRIMTEYLEITASDVGVTPGSNLRSVIPAGFLAAGRWTFQNMYKDAGGAYVMGASWIAAAGQAFIGHYKSDFAAAWTATTADNTELYVSMQYEVQ